MISSEQLKSYRSFYNGARRNEVLEPKVTLMLHLAAAMALGCYP